MTHRRCAGEINSNDILYFEARILAAVGAQHYPAAHHDSAKSLRFKHLGDLILIVVETESYTCNHVALWDPPV